MITAAVDALATLLTGQRDYYSALSSGARDDMVAAWRARIAGERGDAV
jgi:hypothetical protein